MLQINKRVAGVLGNRVAARQREGTRNSLQPLQLAGQGEGACTATRELLILCTNTHSHTEILYFETWRHWCMLATARPRVRLTLILKDFYEDLLQFI